MTATLHGIGQQFAVLADDLTGAHAAAARLRSRGITTKVVWREDALPTRDAVVVNMRTRDCSLDPARETYAWAKALLQAGRSRIELRIDTTLRGSPAEELKGLREATQWTDPLTVVVAAYPGAGRITRDGHQHIRDLSDGRQEIDLAAALFPNSEAGTVGRPDESNPYEAYVDGIRELSDAGVRNLVVDAESDQDLAAAAAAVTAIDDAVGPVITVSSSAWLRYYPKAAYGFHLVVYASPTRANQQQLAHLIEHEPRASVHTPTGPPVPADGLRPSSVIVLETLSVTPTGNPLAETAAEAAVELLAAGKSRGVPCIGVIVSGGHAAGCLVERLEADSIEAIEEMEPLCPRGVIEGGPWHGLSITTKGGGIGDANTLCALLVGRPHQRSPNGGNPTRKQSREETT